MPRKRKERNIQSGKIYLGNIEKNIKRVLQIGGEREEEKEEDEKGEKETEEIM